jgi:hypothetical protein
LKPSLAAKFEGLESKMGLPPYFLDLVQDALLKSYWRKKPFKAFLRRCHISENYLAQLPENESKRESIDRLFQKLERTDSGQRLIRKMAAALAVQTRFPDLETWEDSPQKIKDATEAVDSLRAFLAEEKRDQEGEAEICRRKADALKRREHIIKTRGSLESIRSGLDALCSQLGTAEGGYAFQVWFYDLMDFLEIENRRPYVVDGRQIDGSVTIDGTTYLVELKFTLNATGSPDVDTIFKKVSDKADNTMGIILSMSGYSAVAIDEASSSRSPLLLLDHGHLYMALTCVLPFDEIVRRVRRHSSQEGRAYLPIGEFGGR